MPHPRLLAPLLPLVLALAALLAPVRADDDVAAAPPPHALDRVVVVGASATAGFGAEVALDGAHEGVAVELDLADVLARAIAREESRVEAFSSPLFFTASAEIGPRLARDASRARPTVLVAVDFLFWFGYGHRGVDGAPITDEAQRLALLERGLGLLDRFECPIVVGDFPDMSESVGRMLAAEQMPAAATLEALNERLRAWAATRPRVHVVDLAALVDDMRRGREVRLGESVWPSGRADALIQSDRLHPTGEGLVALALLATDALVEAALVAPEDVVRDRAAILDAVRAAKAEHAAPARAGAG